MMKLTVLDGPKRGQVANVPDSGMLLGRDADCALTLPGDSVSRHHARISLITGVYYVEDLQSTNGVQVNGVPISGRRALMAGDRIRVGDHLLRFVDEQEVLSPDAVARAEAKSLARPPRAPLSTGTKVGLTALCVAVLGLVLVLVLHSLTPPTTPPPGPGPGTALPGSEPLVSAPPESLAPLVLAPAVPASPAAVAPTTTALAKGPPDYYWVRSQPAGALVTVDGQAAGTTPILLRHLAPGNHTLHLTLEHYEPLDRPLVMPHQSEPPVYTLLMQHGVVLLTSVPPNATVVRGKQLVGRTPMWFTDLAPGTYDFRLQALGYQETKASVEVLAYKGSITEVKLENGMGALDILATPPGAKVYVDNQLKGIAEAQEAPELPAKPMHLEGVLIGPRVVAIEFEGTRSKDLKVTVTAGAATKAQPLIWLPNVRVTQTDGAMLMGMLRDRNLLGDLTLATSPTQDQVIPANKVKALKSRPYLEVLKSGPKWPGE